MKHDYCISKGSTRGFDLSFWGLRTLAALSAAAICGLVMATGAYAQTTTTVKLGKAVAESPMAGVATSTDADAMIGTGAWQNVPNQTLFLYIDPNTAPFDGLLAGVTVGDIAGVTYNTKNGGETANVDFAFQIYTKPDGNDDGAGWYGYRLKAEPLYANGFQTTPGSWNEYGTGAGAADGQLIFYDYFTNQGFVGPGPTLADLHAGSVDWGTYPNSGSNKVVADYSSEEVLAFVWASSSGGNWVNFDGLLDDLVIELTNGDKVVIDLEHQADVVYVDDDWAALNPGEEPVSGQYIGFNAFATITGGVTYVGDSTVNVADGTYAESVSIDKTLTLQATGGIAKTAAAAAVVGNVVVANGADDTVVDGLTITPTSGWAIDVKTAGNVTVQHNAITGLGPGGAVDGIRYAGSAPASPGSVLNNTIEDVDLGIYIDHDNAGTFTVTGNTVTNSRKALGLGSASDADVQGNTFSSYSEAGLELFTALNSVSGNDFSDGTTGNPLRGAHVVDANGSLVQADLLADNTFDQYAVVVGGNTIYSTIAGAVDAASVSDVVQVSAGTFAEPNPLVLDDASVTLQGAGSTSSMINSSAVGGQGAVVISADGVTVDGFKVYGQTAQSALYVTANHSGATVSNNHLVSTAGKNALLTEGGQADHAFTGNTFEGNGGGQIVYVNGEASLGTANASTNVDVTDNTFDGGNNLALGHEADDSDVTGNTFHTPAGYARLELWGSNDVVTGNTFEDDGGAITGAQIIDQTSTLSLTDLLSDNTFDKAVTTTSVTNTIFGTIQGAVDAATAGDEVDIFAGTYAEDVNVDKGLTLQPGVLGVPKTATVTVTVNGTITVGNGADDTVIDGLGITPASGTAVTVLTAGNVTVQHNTITGLGPGGAVDGISYTSSAPASPGQVLDNVLTNTDVGLSIDHDNAGTFTVSRNTFTNSRKAISVGSGSDAAVTNNVIDGYTSAGIEVFNTATIHDNSIVNAGPMAVAKAGIGAYGLDNQGSNTLDATYNWWGTNDPAAVAALVNGNADFDPWLPTATEYGDPTDAANGFQGLVLVSISGTVTETNGDPLAGVTVTLEGNHSANVATEMTDAGGTYGFDAGSGKQVPAGGDYTLTPSQDLAGALAKTVLEAANFAPNARTYAPLEDDVDVANFVRVDEAVPGVTVETTGTASDAGGGSFTATVTKDGVTSTVTVDVDPDDISSDVTIEIGTFDTPPPGFPGVFGTPLFYLGPPGLTFDNPVTITLEVDLSTLPAALDVADMQILHYDELTGTYEFLPTTFTPPNILSAELSSFSGVGASSAFDFGDLPDPTFPTLLANDGPRHAVGTGTLFLGASVDADADGQQSAAADGDDDDGTDDEDGVVLNSAARYDTSPSSGSISVTSSGVGKLNAWIDLNLSGSFQAFEQVLTDEPIGAETKVFSFPIPPGSIVGSAAGRIRLNSTGGLSYTGAAADGEVEDYLFTLVDGDNNAAVITLNEGGGDVTVTHVANTVVIKQGDDVLAVLPDDAAVQIDGTSGDDNFDVDFVPAGGLTINGAAGSDALALDQGDTRNGLLTFNGGSGGVDENDQITITDVGSVGGDTEYTFTNNSDGFIDMDDDGDDDVGYTGLEPISTSMVAGTLTLTFNAGPETITLSDDGDVNDDASQIDSDVGAEMLTFADPTTALVVNAGTGADVIDVTGLDQQFAATLTINGDAGDDTFNVADLDLDAQIDVFLNGNDGSDSFNIDAPVNKDLDIEVDGGDPAPPASPGDVLTIDFSSLSDPLRDPVLTFTNEATGTGDWTFDGVDQNNTAEPVHFTNIETQGNLAPVDGPDIAVNIVEVSDGDVLLGDTGGPIQHPNDQEIDIINLDQEATLRFRVFNLRQSMLTSFAVKVFFPSDDDPPVASDAVAIKDGSAVIACTDDPNNTCAFDDETGILSFEGELTQYNDPVDVTLTLVPLHADEEVRIDVTVQSTDPAEPAVVTQNNFDTNYDPGDKQTLRFRAPDLRTTMALEVDTGGGFGGVAFPANLSTGDRVKVTVTVTNLDANTDGLTVLDAVAALVDVSVPGVTVDLTTPFVFNKCGTCSFDPVTGIWNIGSGVARGDDDVTLTFEGSVQDLNFAGVWTSEARAVVPTEDDETDNRFAGGVTINQAPVWTALDQGPFDGTVTRLLVTQGSIDVFAGTDGSGIYTSNDAGQNWCRSTGDVLGPFIRGIALLEDDVLVAGAFDLTTAGAGRGGIFRSIDGGRTWNVAGIQPGVADTGTPDPTVQSLLRFDHDGHTRVAAGTRGGVYVSVSGDAWGKDLTPASSDGRDFLALASDDDQLLMAATGDGVIYTTDDPLSAIPPTMVVVNGPGVAGNFFGGRPVFDLYHHMPGGTSTFYAAYLGGVATSVDDGVSWTDLPLGPDAKAMRSVVAYSSGGTEYLVAGGDGGQIFISTDGGATWTLSGIGFPNLTVYDLFQYTDGGQSFLYAASGNGGLFVSMDNGTSWQQSQIKLPALEVNALANDDDDLLAGTWGFGVYRYDSSCGWLPIGGQPTVENSNIGDRGLRLPWIYSLAVSTTTGSYFAGTAGDGVYRSTNDGGSWIRSGLPNVNAFDLDIFATENGLETVLSGSDQSLIFRTVDDGLTWTRFVAGTPQSLTAVKGIRRPDFDDIYLVGTFGAGVMRSADAGETWTQTNLTTQHVYDFAESQDALAATFDNRIFAATATGIYLSDNDAGGGYGSSWVPLTDPLVQGKDIRAITIVGPRLYASVWGGGVVVSDASGDITTMGDAGTWSKADLDDVNIKAFMARLVRDDDGVLYEEVYGVTDDGDVYVRRQLTSQRFSPVDREEDPAEEIPTDYVLEQNYPNPFNPSTTIAFALPEAARVHLAVYDVLGRQVATLVDGNVPAGRHEVTFEAGDLPSGTYFYRLVTPQQTFTKQMVLMK